MVPDEVNNPHYQEEIGLLLHNGDKGEYIWTTRDTLGCPVIKINVKLQQPKEQASYGLRHLKDEGSGHHIR